MFEFAGGGPAFFAPATAHHARSTVLEGLAVPPLSWDGLVSSGVNR
jgi:hypothetical protein